MGSTGWDAISGGNLLCVSLPIERNVVYIGLIHNKNDRASAFARPCLADAPLMIARIDKGDAK